jgi:hypothetical protein
MDLATRDQISSHQYDWIWRLRLDEGKGNGWRKHAAAVSPDCAVTPSSPAMVSPPPSPPFFGRGRKVGARRSATSFRFARERIHEVGGVGQFPAGFTVFAWVCSGCDPRPGLTEQPYQSIREQNPIGTDPRGSAGIGLQTRRGRG